MSELQETILRGNRLRARGAGSNATGRFEGQSVTAFDDGWADDGDARLIRTEVRDEVARTAITYNRSPDLPFDRSVNPYRGCEHGCAYCYARPSHAWLNMSAGLDFETRLVARPNIATVLAGELRAQSYAVAPIALGTNTDPYQPLEADRGLMRQVVQVLSDFNHPLAITTKGTLIERDIDLLAPMAAKGLLRVGISITTLDANLSRRLEPRAPSPARRLATIRRLAEAGVEVRAMIAPVIPALTDHELEPLMEAAAEAGAKAASWIALRLPLEVAPLFRDWLETHAPLRAARVMGRVREMQGGRDYTPDWGARFTGQGVWADLLAKRFDAALPRYGLVKRLPDLRRDLFRPPPRAGDQLALF